MYIIHTAKEQLSVLIKSVPLYDYCLEKPASARPLIVKTIEVRRGGGGTTNAVNLHLVLSCAEIGTFKRGIDERPV